MSQPTERSRTVFLAIAALLGCFAVIAQMYLMIVDRRTSLPEALIRYFSYFTILTNLLVAVALSALLFRSTSRAGRFLVRPTTLSATTVYIFVVGLVYNLILRALWQPQGIQHTVNELLHTFMPLLFLLYWIIFVPKQTLYWKNAFPWLFYPLFYLIFIMVRGFCSGFYPYPFVDLQKLGYQTVLINCLILGLVFLGFSLALIGLSKIGKRRA
jgi:hypothetical protein